MWTIAHYLQVSLFSLRPALSTASGAQSLLIPTPYAIKMALVNASIQLFGSEITQDYWPLIRELDIALSLPEMVMVNKTFIKIQRPTRVTQSKPEEIEEAKAKGIYPMGPTIAFREFVQFEGSLGIALRGTQTSQLQLAQLLVQINYLGKRGGFFQLQELPISKVDLDSNWTILTKPSNSFPIHGTLQLLDDCGNRLSWDHVNIYSGKSISLNDSERILRTIVLPLRLQRSSYRYSLYQRIPPSTD